MIDPTVLSTGARLVLFAFQASKFKEVDDATVLEIDGMEKAGATQEEISKRLEEKLLAAESTMNQSIEDARKREQQG